MFTAPQHKSLWLQHHNNSDPPYEILEDELIDIENRKEQEKEDNNTPVVEVNILEWVLEATAPADLPAEPAPRRPARHQRSPRRR